MTFFHEYFILPTTRLLFLLLYPLPQQRYTASIIFRVFFPGHLYPPSLSLLFVIYFLSSSFH